MENARSMSVERICVLRTVVLVSALLAELLWITFRFDGASISADFGWLKWLIQQASLLPQAAVVLVAAYLVIGGSRHETLSTEFVAESGSHSRWLAWFAGHSAAFFVFWTLSGAVFEANLQDAPWPLTWVIAWGGAALCCVLLWLLALAPAPFWLKLGRSESPILMIGGVISAAALLAGRLARSFWEPLGDATFSLVEHMLRPLYPHIATDSAERLIGTSKFSVHVSSQCSGYEGIGLICVFLTAFFWTYRERLRFPSAWFLWPIGILGIWLLNAVRIAALVALGISYSPVIAAGGFHSQAGWLLFNAVALALMFTALQLPFFTKLSGRISFEQGSSPVVLHLAPFFSLTAMGMIVTALTDGMEYLYPIKVLVTAISLWFCRCAWQGSRMTWSWPAVLDGLVAFGLWIAIIGLRGATDSKIPAGLGGLSPVVAGAWLVFRVLGGVVTVPLAEELAFRGYLLRRLTAAEFNVIPYERTTWSAVLVSSALFGFMHSQWLGGTVAGFCYALTARRRGQLSDAVLAHAVTNALIAGTVLSTGAWWLW